MARKKHLINVHTSTGTTAPTGASLYLGEIAVQHTPNDPALWIKVGSAETSTEYEKFIGKTEITNIFNQSRILGSAYTYTGIPYVNSATTLEAAYSALTKEVIDDETVAAAALNDLNGRVAELSGSVSDIDIAPLSASVVNNANSVSAVSGMILSLSAEVKDNELVTAAALNDLNSRIIELSGNTPDIPDNIVDIIEENEETTAAALNELNERVGTVETRMTGDYIPLTGFEVATGTTEEELTLKEEDTVNEAFGKLQKQMLDNEEAIAAGLNDLNTRLNNVDELIAHNTGVTQLSGAVRSLSAATYYELGNVWEELDNKADNYNLNNLSGAVMGISAKTSGILTINANGVEQGRYSPSANTTIDLQIVQDVTGADVLLTGYELATGTTEEELAIVATDTVNEAFGKIQKQNYDNEAVVAGALNDLDERINALEELSGMVEDNELVTAAALNDLNAKIVDLSGNTSYDVSNLNSQLNILSGAVAVISGNTGGDAVTAVTLNGTGNAVTDASFINSALTLTKGNVVTGVTMNSAAKTVSNGVVDLGAVLTAETSVSVSDGATGDTAAAVVTGITTGGTKGHNLTLTKSNKVFSASTTDSAVTSLSAITSLSAQTSILGPAYTYNGLPYVTSATSVADAYSALTEELFKDEKVTSTALNDLNDRIVDLSGDTSDISDSVSNYGQQIQVLSGIVADISGNTGGGGGGGTDTACTEAGHYAPTTSASTKGTTAATTNYIKGIRLDSKNHVIDVVTGAVVTAQTQLSTATTGAGNVITDITVSNHQITKNFGMTVPSWATASTKPSYTLDEVNDGTTRKLSNYATTGTVDSLSAATTAMSAATTAHTADTTVHVTSTEKSTWNGKANTSDITITGLTVGGTNATVTNKVAAVPTASTSTFGVVKIPAQATSFLTNTSGTISVATGTGTNQVAKGSDFAAVSAATTAHTADTTVHVTAANKTTWNGKQDAISDLATIRTNAASGMAAYNNVNALSAATTAMSVNVGKIAVTGVTVTGTGNAVTNASYSNSALTLTKGNVQATISDLSTIRNNASSGAAAYTAVTAHTGNTSVHVPSHSSSDSGKVLSVDSNGNLVWITTVSVYTGSQSPAQSLGNDGDIYLQTS